MRKWGVLKFIFTLPKILEEKIKNTWTNITTGLTNCIYIHFTSLLLSLPDVELPLADPGKVKSKV